AFNCCYPRLPLEAEQNSRRKTSVIVVAKTVEARNHPVELDETQGDLLVSHIDAAADEHRDSVRAPAANRGMSAAEEGMSEGGQVTFVTRDHRSRRRGHKLKTL